MIRDQNIAGIVLTWLFAPEALLIGGETTHSWAGVGQAAERFF